MNRILITVDMQKCYVKKKQRDIESKLLNLIVNKTFDKVMSTMYVENGKRIFDYSDYSQSLAFGLDYSSNDVFKRSTYNCLNTDFVSRLSRLNGGSLPKEVYLAGSDVSCSLYFLAVGLQEMGIKPIILIDYSWSYRSLQDYMVGSYMLGSVLGDGCIHKGKLKILDD